MTLSSIVEIDDDSEKLQKLNIVLKADTSGSIEAVKSCLSKLPQDAITLRQVILIKL